MTVISIIQRLQIDPGLRTLGELLQDREAAAYEIQRMQSEINHLRSRSLHPAKAREDGSRPAPYRGGTYISIKQVCGLLGISRSTIYKRVSEGSFPPPIRVGARTVRWSVDTIEAWREGL